MSNKKQRISDTGVALVKDFIEYKQFITEFMDDDLVIFNDLEEWYRFFCSEDISYMDFSNFPKENVETVLEVLYERLDDDKVPSDYPALIVFDFENYSPYIRSYNAMFHIIPLSDLKVKSIEYEASEGPPVVYVQ